MRRRQYLTAAGGAVAAAVTLGVVSAQADWSAKPDHVTLEFDQAALENYQPLLVTGQGFRERFKGMYGYIARSDQYKYDVHCYISQLTHQNGLPLLGADSHLGDHEPIYVFVNDAGDPELFVYSGYHWFAAELAGDDANLTQDRMSEPTHVNLNVDPRWDNYSHEPDQSGVFFDLENWVSARDSWVSNGFYSSAEAAAFEDPDTMRSRDSWWEDGSIDGRVARALGWAGLLAGLFGGDAADV